VRALLLAYRSESSVDGRAADLVVARSAPLFLKSRRFIRRSGWIEIAPSSLQADLRPRFSRRHSRLRGTCLPGRESTWISPRFIEAYLELHRQGHAHSVEVCAGRLVGGITACIRGFFRGESMFHRETDASKIALCHLMEHLRARKFELSTRRSFPPHRAARGDRNSAARLFGAARIGLAQPGQF